MPSDDVRHGREDAHQGMYLLRPATPVNVLRSATDSNVNADGNAVYDHGIMSCSPVGTETTWCIGNKSAASNVASNPADRRQDYIINAVATDVSVNYPDRVDDYD